MHAGSQSQANAHMATTWGPSAIRPKGQQLPMYHGAGPFQIPQAMTAEHIGQVRDAFVSAARQALAPDVPADLFGPVANLKDWELVGAPEDRLPGAQRL